ncbi:MAG: DUF3830 family protein [Bacillota bacterium]
MRKLKIKFERGGEVYATLLEEKAPNTCNGIWNQLPIESEMTHTRWSGREIYTSITDRPNLVRENQAIYMSVGEVCYWRDWTWEESPTPPQAISIYYGADMARSQKGSEQVNVFAQVDYQDFKKLAEIGERVWLKGKEKVFIDRYEEKVHVEGYEGKEKVY